MKINLLRLKRSPPKPQQRMRQLIIRNPNFLRHGIPTGNSSLARAQRRPIHTLTPTPSIRIKRITRKPVIAVARLTSCAIRIKPTALPINISALQLTLQETIFSRLFLLGAREISRPQEEVGQSLIGLEHVDIVNYPGVP